MQKRLKTEIIYKPINITEQMKRILTIVASMALAVSTLSAQELTNFAWGGKPVVSPEVKNDSVTFRLKADYATVVKLSGSWMPRPRVEFNFGRPAKRMAARSRESISKLNRIFKSLRMALFM